MVGCEELLKINWSNAVVTFASVFLGALFAYKFGLKLEKLKFKRQMRGDFCSLVSQIYLNLCELIEHKKLNLDVIKKDFDENNFQKYYYFEDLPKTDFSFDISKYIFLNDCNRYLLSELSKVKIFDNRLKKIFLDYFSRIDCYTKTHIAFAGPDKTIIFLMQSFSKTYKSYMEFCTYVYYLYLHLATCYKKFFNVNYFDDLDKDEDLDDLIKEIPEDILKSDYFIKIDNNVNSLWKPERTLKGDLDFLRRKLKFRLSFIKKYLFSRKKRNKTK